MCVCVESLSPVCDSQAPLSMEFAKQRIPVSHSFFQGIFSTQGWNPLSSARWQAGFFRSLKEARVLGLEEDGCHTTSEMLFTGLGKMALNIVIREKNTAKADKNITKGNEFQKEGRIAKSYVNYRKET